MSEMVERAAKAIYECWAESRGCEVPWHEVESLKHSFGALARAEARAVIKSMREPTEAMLIAGHCTTSADKLEAGYQAMIDEALK